MKGQVVNLVPMTSVPAGTLVQLNRLKAQSNYEDPLGPDTRSVDATQTPWDARPIQLAAVQATTPPRCHEGILKKWAY